MSDNTPSLAYRAMIFAREVHKNQRRKYTNNPYIDHLAEVAGIAATIPSNEQPMDIILSVAWLHDCVEDQGVGIDHLTQNFGPVVGHGVWLLSDLETGNRTERKRLSRQRLALAPAWIQTIKCADLISNTSSIVVHDPKFAITYLEEKRLLLDVMTAAHPGLWRLAKDQSEALSACGVE